LRDDLCAAFDVMAGLDPGHDEEKPRCTTRDPSMTAYLIVRAEVVDAAERERCERWYGEEHLSDALKAFRARRGWSDGDPAVHDAFYEFAAIAAVRSVIRIGNPQAFFALSPRRAAAARRSGPQHGLDRHRRMGEGRAIRGALGRAA